MKIFHVLTHFLPDQIAGTEMYVFSLQQQIQQIGFTGGVIIPLFDPTKSLDYEYNGVTVYRYLQDNIITDSIQKGFLPPSGIVNFDSLIEKLNPDVLHFHELSGSNGITIHHLEIAQRRNIPVVFTMHLTGYVCATGSLIKNKSKKCNGLIKGFNCSYCTFRHQDLSFFPSFLASLVSQLFFKSGYSAYRRTGKIAGLLGRREMISRHQNKLKRISALSTKIVVLNNWFSDMLLKNGVPPNKIYVVKQSLPYVSNDLNTSPTVIRKKSTDLNIVYVGRIYPAKGLHILLQALNQLNDASYTLDIYGASNEDEYFIKCQKLISNNDKIKISGLIPPGRAVSVLKNYNLLCIPSIVTEMAPLVIQEAFAAGITVLASDVLGNSAYIQDMINGILFKVGSVTDLKHKIENLLSHPKVLDRLRENILPVAGFDSVCNSYLDIYKNITGHG